MDQRHRQHRETSAEDQRLHGMAASSDKAPAANDNVVGRKKKRNQGNDAAVLVPLLFESGMDSLELDAVLCVSCPEELVFQRLEKRGLNRADAERRISAQMPLSEKERRADFTVSNAGTRQELKEEIKEAVQKAYRLKGRL